jgi:hypothetical protein
MMGKSCLWLGIILLSTAAGRNNELTSSELADGYQLLWNGRDLAGWLLDNSRRGAPGNPDTAGNWAVVSAQGVEGAGHKSADPDSNVLEIISAGSSIFTQDSSFKNFDWKVEWQSPSGNSRTSLIYFYNPAQRDVQGIGLNYAIMNSNWSIEWKTLLNTAGCLYELVPLLPSRKNPDLSPNWTRPDGEWNQARVVAYGKRVAHFGNGLRLLEYNVKSPDFKNALSLSKAYAVLSREHPLSSEDPIYPGALKLQDHGQKWIKFRNLKVKHLTEDPWGPDSPYLNRAATAAGDTSLIDTLPFDRNFSNRAEGIGPNIIAPKIAVRATAGADGVEVEFSEPGDYRITLEDVRGQRFSEHRLRNGNRIFIPGDFTQSPRVLMVRRNGRKIHSEIIGKGTP